MTVSSIISVPKLTADADVWFGKTGGNPLRGSIVAGTGMSLSFNNITGALTLNSIGGGATTVEVTGTSATMVVNTNYIANNAALVTLTMPATIAQGDIIRIYGKGAGGWKVQCNGGQVINFGSNPTTSGGSLSSTNQFDVVEISCITANTTFVCNGVQGFLTPA